MSALSNKLFGNLVRGAINAIADFEGQNVSIIEAELSERICMAPTALHRFKAGQVPRDPLVVEVLAEAGVRRAYLNRTWLQRFLHTARYHDSAAMIERLFPPEPELPALERACHNLPPLTASTFVLRPEPFDAVLEGLRRRCAAVVIVSLGGMGKTSLAREVATRCLDESSPGGDVPRFDAAVWVSDKGTPGTLVLNQVLDELAYTLDFPGLTQFEPARKRREIDQLLRKRRTLLIVDNFETITDAELLPWLMRLPEPSKALITTREHRKEFHQGAWLVELGGMTEAEARQLLAERARQLNLSHPSDEITGELIAMTGGNPKAMEVVLGLVKRRGLPFVEAAAQLHTRFETLFAELFTLSWGLLEQEAQQLLIATTLFPTSVPSAVLATVAGLDTSAFYAAAEQLSELALLDTELGSGASQPEGKDTRRAIHPLTRAFMEAQQPVFAPFLAEARERWLTWAVGFASKVGYTIEDMSRLEPLDDEEPTLLAALTWAYEQHRDGAVIQIAKGLEFYYYVRGLWGKKLQLHLLYIAAARRLADVGEEIAALTMHIQLLSRQSNRLEAERFVPRLLELARTDSLRGELAFHVEHALGLYLLAGSHTAEAEDRWRRILGHVTEWGLPDHMVIGAQHWLAVCLVQQGQAETARSLYESALALAHEHQYRRMIARNQLHLALLDLGQGGAARAMERLEECLAHTGERDWEQHARIQQTRAEIFLRMGDRARAGEALVRASTLFERMGLTLESQAARATYATLT